MCYWIGIFGCFFQVFGKNGINIIVIVQGLSELNILVVIFKLDEIKVLNVLYEVFFLSDIQELYFFMVGVGLIGSILLC